MGDLYDSLNSETNQIRVVELVPGRWNDAINCNMRTVSLDEQPSYEALSYVWGDPKDTVPIIVNGTSFPATRNLVAALLRVRSSVTPRTIWVDAMCINQKSLDERTQQILIMGRIYEVASSVLVFLGESGILDLVPLEEQATWDDPPRPEWHFKGCFLMQADMPPSRAGMDSTGAVEDLSKLFSFSEEDLSEYDPVDPKESPMWAVMGSTNEIEDQPRVDSFFARQRDPDYPGNKLSAIETFRDGQAGAFTIMNVLAHGRCLKSCLQSDVSSASWIKALEVIDHLTKLPWWIRVWVLQEAILPQNAVIAIYGEIQAPIQLIEDSGSILPRHYERGECCKAFWNYLPQDQRDTFDRFAKLMTPIEGIRDYRNQIRDDQLVMLMFLLKQTRHRKATDPRDKIFGLLGLVSHGPNPTGIVPDYKRTEAQVYTDVAMRIIRHLQNLSPLFAVREDKGLVTGLPTWVPNWTRPIGGTASDYLAYERLRHFMAWPPSPGTPLQLVNDYALAVTGVSVDQVAAVTKPHFQDETELAKAIDELETFFGLADDPFALYKEELPLFDAFWRTAVGDLLYSISYEMKAGMIKFGRVHKGDIQMLSMAKYAWGNKLKNLSFLAPDGHLISDEEMAHIAQFARENFWYANEGKVFFKTTDGYIGSGPADTKVNNQVVLVHGSTVPLVLQSTAGIPPLPSCSGGTVASPAGPCYQFVGCAYVLGLMDREAALGQDDNSIREQATHMGELYSADLHIAGLRQLVNKPVERMYLV